MGCGIKSKIADYLIEKEYKNLLYALIFNLLVQKFRLLEVKNSNACSLHDIKWQW